MDIGGPYTARTPSFYVVINGNRMKPFGKGVAPYRFNADRARQASECTELNNKVERVNISIEPVETA